MVRFGKETKETYYKFDIEIDDEDYKKLKNYAIEHIFSDDMALINYAIVRILTEQIKAGNSELVKPPKNIKKSKKVK